MEKENNLVEILGDELDEVMKFFELSATKTYQNTNEHTDFRQVWEMSEYTLNHLENIPEDIWTAAGYGWYRYAKGSVMGPVHKRYCINHHYIKAWDGAGREDQEEENKHLTPDDRYFQERTYDNLLDYFCEELGASTEKNVTALAIDLAKQNGMKLSELFKRYQGE